MRTWMEYINNNFDYWCCPLLCLRQKKTSPQPFPRVVPPPFLLLACTLSIQMPILFCLRLHQTGLKPIQDGNLEPLYRGDRV